MRPIPAHDPKGSTRRVAVSHTAAAYRVRLAELDGRFGGDIPLSSDSVAGALREVCFHSVESVGFELWQGRRMILKAFPVTETASQEPGRQEADRDPPPEVWK